MRRSYNNIYTQDTNFSGKSLKQIYFDCGFRRIGTTINSYLTLNLFSATTSESLEQENDVFQEMLTTVEMEAKPVRPDCHIQKVGGKAFVRSMFSHFILIANFKSASIIRNDKLIVN